MKTCYLCHIPKEESEFYKHINTSDKLRHECKECHKALVNSFREKSAMTKEKGNEPMLKSRFFRQMKNHHKVKARTQVNSALRNGTLERKPCEVCGVGETQAHHDDYSKPLEVRWLCPKHHLVLHRKY